MITELLSLGIAVSVISLTLTSSTLLEPTRNWLLKKLNKDSTCDKFFIELIECQFCVGFWLSLIFTLIYRPIILSGWYPLSLFVSSLVMTAVSSVSSRLIIWSLDQQ